MRIKETGSTGTMVGVSTGLEPYFSFSYFRSGRLGKFIEVKADIVQEYLDDIQKQIRKIFQIGLLQRWNWHLKRMRISMCHPTLD